MATFKGAAKEAQRAALLMKQREKERQELEFQKKKLASEMRVGEISTRFAVHYDSIEQQLRTETIGLVTLDEMKARQKAYMAQREQELALGDKANQLKSESSYADRKAKLQPSLLSFQDCDDDEEEVTEELSQIVNPPSVPSESPGSLDENKVNSSNPKDPALPFENTAVDVTPVDTTSEVPVKRRRLGKNPTVDTSFLPDIDRDEEEKRLREELRCEWVAKQATVKDEDIIITYSYWDGSGHRKQVRVKKGHSIHIFLCRCLEQLRKDFSELKGASADQLMFIKEDLIIPHHHTFYDFIVTKARGKSGALFCFDVHDDVRMVIDSKVERDESHAGKICLRSWYERNKHIFPASRWEPYDPTKNWDHYTISDKMAAKITVK